MNLEKEIYEQANIEELKKIDLVENDVVLPIYIDIYRLYSFLFMEYLDRKIQLRKRESEIKNSLFHLQPLNEEEKDFYQLLSPLEFFYIRNHLNIEKIPKKSLQVLIDRCKEKNNELDSIVEGIIQETYLDVITNDQFAKKSSINYALNGTIPLMASNDSIVLGLRRDPEYEKGVGHNPEWVELSIKKDLLLEALKQIVEEDAKNNGLKLTVFIFNEVTTKK